MAEDLSLDFFSTAFDASAVDFLEELGVPVHKGLHRGETCGVSTPMTWIYCPLNRDSRRHVTSLNDQTD
jgi:hypothetical protein